MSVQFHNPSISSQKHPLGCILQSIFIILRPNIKTNLTDYHIFFLQFHTWFSHSQDIWLCFSYILRGVLPKVNFPRRHSHLYWFVNSREPLQTGRQIPNWRPPSNLIGMEPLSQKLKDHCHWISPLDYQSTMWGNLLSTLCYHYQFRAVGQKIILCKSTTSRKKLRQTKVAASKRL